MSELRHDPLNKRWVIIASERAERPQEFVVDGSTTNGLAACPFCEGNEDATPPEIAVRRPPPGLPNGPGWRVRVVPNRYPALAIEGLPERRGVGLYDRMRGIGAHEVIIETPEHALEISRQPVAHVEEVVSMWRERVADLMRDRRFKYVLLFKNEGALAGASLAHPHSQIVATPVTPREIAVQLEASYTHFRAKERCLFTDLLDQEIAEGHRIVYESDEFVAFCPYASRFPFETVLAPRRQTHDFGRLDPKLVPGFSRALKDVLSRLRALLRDCPYNLVLHTAPNAHVEPHRSHWFETLAHDWHWYLAILPRLTRVAGFEWGTGFHINPTPPEEAARLLREVFS